MVRRCLIPLVLLILAGSVSPAPLAAQEVPANVRRVTAVGTYGGTLKGTSTPRKVANSEIQEKADCDVTLKFRPDGKVEVELRRYLHETTEIKRSPAGNFKIVTRITGQSGRIVVDSRLFLLVTSPTVLVREAKWQREPGPDFPGYVEHEVWISTGPDQQGREQWRKNPSQPPKSTPVFCHPLVRWRGPNNTGPGLPLNGRWTGPDPEHPWVKIDAAWDLKLL